MKSRREIAMELFLQGYTCAQSVVIAFEDILPLDREMLARVSSSFGGGMGRLREVCGTVSGMFIVIGILQGFDTDKPGEAKATHYAKVQELAHRFEDRNGSIVCRELLGLDVKREAPVPEERTAEYYKKRPCKELVGSAAEILEEYLIEEGLIE